MKFCKPHIYEYKNREVLTTVNYVTLADVKQTHGDVFAEQWYSFIKDYKKVDIDCEAFYFADYKQIAIRTYMYLDVV